MNQSANKSFDNETEKIILFIKQNEDVIIKDKCIQKICESGKVEKIEIAFINACMNGSLKDVEYILENCNVDPNSGIVSACRGGYVDVVSVLLKYGANPNFIDRKNKYWTPMIATMVGNNWDDKNKDLVINELVKYGGIIDGMVFYYTNSYLNYSNSIKQSKYSNYELMKYIF